MSHARIFRYFKTSPEIIRLAVMLYVRYPLSLRNVEDLLHERGIDITHETVRFWWMRSLQTFAAVHGSIHNHFNQERTLIQTRLQGTTRRRTHRVASTLCGLIHAGVGGFPRLFWFV